MTEQQPERTDEPTPVDDVRRVRERLSREAGGDIHKLVEDSARVVEEYRVQLNLKIVRAPEQLGRRPVA